MIRALIVAALLAVIAAVTGLTGGAVVGLVDQALGGPDPAELADLTIAPEDTGHHYNRDQWGSWTYHGEGCDTRELVLRQRGTDVLRGKGCRSLAGRWVSRYTGATLTDSASIDIDHLVPLAEANRSGVRGWDDARRVRFANDRANLHPVEAAINRQKSDQGPAEWLPDRDRCGYVRQWIAVKVEYGLTADPAEHAALASVLARCDRPTATAGDRPADRDRVTATGAPSVTDPATVSVTAGPTATATGADHPGDRVTGHQWSTQGVA